MGHPRSLAYGVGPRTRIALTGNSRVGRACRMVVRAGRWSGLPLGLIFRFLIHRFTRLTGRADGGIVGTQASGDARALRRSVGLVISTRMAHVGITWGEHRLRKKSGAKVGLTPVLRFTAPELRCSRKQLYVNF